MISCLFPDSRPQLPLSPQFPTYQQQPQLPYYPQQPSHPSSSNPINCLTYPSSSMPCYSNPSASGQVVLVNSGAAGGHPLSAQPTLYG